MVRAGEQAPDFTLPDQDGNPVRLSDLRGGLVVLYFYPKADTPGCTTQACGIRDHRGDYEQAGAKVLGVSPDTVTAIRNFAEKYTLDFELLADEDHAVAETYGVWGEKSMYGKKFMGIVRSAFLVDAKGRIAEAWYKVSPKDTPKNLLTALDEG